MSCHPNLVSIIADARCSVNVANALNKTGRKLPVGYPDLPTENPPFLLYDASRSKDILGMTYRSMEETTRDTLADYDARGWA